MVYLEKPADRARAHTANSSEIAWRTASATFGPARGARFPAIACEYRAIPVTKCGLLHELQPLWPAHARHIILIADT